MVERLIESDMCFLTKIDWFSDIGKGSVLSVRDATGMIESLEWENFQLDRSGDSTEYLCINNRNEYREWNSITQDIKQYLNSEVFPLIEIALKNVCLPESIFPSIKWDIVAYLQEKTYESFGIPKFYYLLIDSYSRGKLPCGWEGEYPSGKIIEY